MIREKDAALAKAIAFEAEAKAGFRIDYFDSLFRWLLSIVYWAKMWFENEQ